MAINGTTTNYSGRKKDVHIFQGVDATKIDATPVTPSFGRVSNYCAGIQKLIQRYAISLLTNIGSQINYPDFGTNLLTRLNNRSLSLNRMDVFPIFNIASSKVVNEFREYQANNTDLPDDEKLNTAFLEDVQVSNNRVNLRIRLIPVSADPVTFIIPLPTE